MWGPQTPISGLRFPPALYNVGPRREEQRLPSLPCVCTENEIAKIPAHTFLGLPNLEWLDLSKNKLDVFGLHPHAFKVHSIPSSWSPAGTSARGISDIG